MKSKVRYSHKLNSASMDLMSHDPKLGVLFSHADTSREFLDDFVIFAPKIIWVPTGIFSEVIPVRTTGYVLM